MRVGSIAELWVYPVKSMRGQRVASVMLDPEGIRGDRRFAFESSDAPAGKPLLTGRERAAILLYSPQNPNKGSQVRTPDGESLPLHSSKLAERFGRGEENGASFRLLASPGKPLTDVRPLSLISAATLAALSEEMGKGIKPQRFRSNIVLQLDDGAAFAEEAWNGKGLRFGDAQDGAEITVLERIPRCRMVSLDPETAEPDHTILKHLARAHAGRLGVYGAVRHAGTLAEGQAVYLL